MPVPPNVPEDAQYVANSGTWVHGQRDERGKPHGRQRVYDKAGALVSEMLFEHGELHGPFKRFHPNGELAREGRFERGQLEGEVVAYASSEPSPELLRPCCVPSAARSLKADYVRGRRQSEVFFDANGRRLLDDGSLHPERPASVAEGARYVAHASRWVLGESDGERRRHGRWVWWSLDGELEEDAEYAHGKRHGVSRFYSPEPTLGDGPRLRQLGEFDDGLEHGHWFERVSAGVYSDPRIVIREGHFHRGRRFGEWTYSDAHSECVEKVNYGEPISERQIVDLMMDPRATAPDSAESDLHRLVALADTDGLRAWCGRRAPPLSPRASAELLAKIRGDKASWEDKLAQLSHALSGGAEPSECLREIASLLMNEPERASCYVDAAVSLDGKSAQALATRALIRLELGHVPGADADIARVAEVSRTAAEQLALSRRVLFPRFDYWPSTVELGTHVSDELPSEVTQPLTAVCQGIAKSARRLSLLRAAVCERVGVEQADWLPPEVDVPAREVVLDSYTFETDTDGERDTIVVDERVHVGDDSVGQLMKRIRVEWTTLCWLCWGAGLDRVAWPERSSPRPEFARALVTAFQRHWRLQDRIQTGGLRARVQGVVGFSWSDMPIDQLSVVHAQQALAEQLEMRAVLFFLGDASCRSVWQDDLRA